ncbi:exo-alpha-sialidase [Tateyamaria sp. syn59]|uniref:exo-alpha-sialidase n=1 Tax=Tateyamaria sp. syn59 TaxID=2576942 RepID=UPI0011BDCBF1|nr:exo-alpha-sialidase [Tateyamaria sp. syn59]
MKIEKLGKIFDPGAHQLMHGPGLFAQSPQTIALPDGGVRIYFSTRSADGDSGKFISHVSYADFADDLTTLVDVARHEVLARGPLGAFDEHGVFPLNPVPVGDEVWGYTTGWTRRVSVSVDTAIGLVKSRDGGRTFQRVGTGPVLGASLHEPFLVGDGFVRKIGDTFRMWYIFGQRWERESEDAAPDRVYKIGQAWSENGQTWQHNSGETILPDVLGRNECQALPSVTHFDGEYHMVFCYRHIHGFRTDPSKGYRLGYARSKDGATWERDDAALGLTGTLGAWDADMQCYPHVFVHRGALFLLYNGNAFGKEGFGLARLSP